MPLDASEDVLPLLREPVRDEEVDDADEIHRRHVVREKGRPGPVVGCLRPAAREPVHADQERVVHDAIRAKENCISLVGGTHLPSRLLRELEPVPGLHPVLVFPDCLPGRGLPAVGRAFDVVGLVHGELREHVRHDGEVQPPKLGDVHAVEARVAHDEGLAVPAQVVLVGGQEAEEEGPLRGGDRLDDELLVAREKEELAGLRIRAHGEVRGGVAAQRLQDLVRVGEVPPVEVR
mmetsp:Transcript_39297/g.111087  ORF Transcript_39297/g.111087 Transcript_39297/m.111087 type:complete len:234 (+) Transcript_39297:566-1267(+)